MRINVSKSNNILSTVDLTVEVEGLDNGFISFLVGRSSECHIQLDDKKISREHLKLTFENKKWSLEQLSESTPFRINGEIKRNYVLDSADIITLGPYSIEFIFDQTLNRRLDDSQVPIESSVVDDDIDDLETLDDIELGVEVTQEIEELQDDDNEESFTVEENDDFLNNSSSESSETSDDDIFGNEEGVELDNLNDDGFDDDSYEMEEFDDEKTQVFSGFLSFELEIFGEFAPYDKYLIENEEVFIGRDPQKCQIVLNDPEVSSVHAVVKKNRVICSLEDLKSGNGTLLDGKRINKVNLENRDEFIIGSTTFTIKIGSSFLKKEEQSLMPVEENQFVEVEEVVEVGTDFEGVPEVEEGGSQSLFSKESLQDPEKRKKILIILVVLIGVWVLLDEESADAPQTKAKIKKAKVVTKTDKLKKKFFPEDLEFLSSTYELAKELHNSSRYAEAMTEMEKILPMDKNYKNLLQIYELSKIGLKRLEEQEKLRQAEIERVLRVKKIKELVSKAKVATKARSVEVAEALFQEIMSIDPENTDITLMKRELDSWKRKKEKKALEEAEKISERKRQVRLLAPGKNLYLKEEWHKVIVKLQSYLNLKDIDEDLVKSATTMFNESKTNLEGRVNPLLGKARSLREGQDLKGAYEVYKSILDFHPNHREALIEMDDIRTKLHNRSKKAYREAIISESLSLFNDAKEMFQEVQQISPSDSDYYEKATEKLKDYID